MGLVAIGLRVLTVGLLGGGVRRVVLVRLPEAPLPAGPQGCASEARRPSRACSRPRTNGLRLAAWPAWRHALASPAGCCATCPPTVQDVGTAVVLALTHAPQMVQDAGRVRAARRLRGHSPRGLRSIARLAVPVMAAALPFAGPGRLDGVARVRSAAHRTDASRRGASAMTLGGLLGIFGSIGL